MIKKYKVCFEISGEEITDDMPLNKENLRESILASHDSAKMSYYNRIYSKVSKLQITKIK